MRSTPSRMFSRAVRAANRIEERINPNAQTDTMVPDNGPAGGEPPAGARLVLLIEDEVSLVASVSYFLRRDGFRVVAASDGLAGLQAARSERPDVIVLDLMLPSMDGLEVCRRVRAESTVPILMLTAKTDEIDRVVGLELGADDYMTKPFSMRELAARLRALIRRASGRESQDAGTAVAIGALVIDPTRPHRLPRR